MGICCERHLAGWYAKEEGEPPAAMDESMIPADDLRIPRPILAAMATHPDESVREMAQEIECLSAPRL